MLGVVLHIEIATELSTDGTDERINWAIARANEGLSSAIDVNLGSDLGMASDRFAFQFMADQVVGRNLWEVFVFERIPQHHRADFCSRIFSDVLNVLRELNL